MREFTLENNSGETYRLNDTSHFFESPEGLGFKKNTKYKKIGDRFMVVSEEYEQPELSGKIDFRAETKEAIYQKYTAFCRFLDDTPLTMHYTAGAHHMIDVQADEIEKGEIEAIKGLSVEIKFKALTFFYDEYKESGTESVTVESDSRIESGCHIEIKGRLVNPEWIQTVDGVEVCRGKINGTIQDEETLHIRTDMVPAWEIYKTDAAGNRTDLYDLSDYSTDRFVMILKGTNTISCEGASSISVGGGISYASV